MGSKPDINNYINVGKIVTARKVFDFTKMDLYGGTSTSTDSIRFVKSEADFLNTSYVEVAPSRRVNIGELFFDINPALTKLIDLVEETERLLYLKDDYDDFGGIAPTDENVKSCLDFLILYSEKAFHLDEILMLPFVTEVKNGSIELLWINKDKKTKLVVTFPSDLNKECIYFRKTLREKTQGLLKRDEIEEDFFNWIKKQFTEL